MPRSIDKHPTPAPAPTMALATVAENILQALARPTIVLDGELRAVHRNQSAAALFPPGEPFLATLAGRISCASVADWPTELRRVLASGRAQVYEAVTAPSADGQSRTLQLSAGPFVHGDDEPAIGLLLTVEDVTERTALEKRLAVSESMAAVGRLAARVAHELNNPLDGTLRYIGLCSRMLAQSGDEKVQRYLDEARRGLMRMAGIVGELLEFSRGTHAEVGEGNINWLVEEALRTLREQADRHNVVIAASFRDEKMPSIAGGKLFQVCCNLIKNAIDAMPDGGCLTVCTAILDGQVVIRFEDTGVGLPENIERIFEPFYTTKAPGQGTGLGLAICRDYIHQLHGQITAENGEDKGAVFTIRIPLTSCTPAP